MGTGGLARAAKGPAVRRLGHLMLAVVLVIGLMPLQYYALSTAAAVPAYADDGVQKAYQDTDVHAAENADAGKVGQDAQMTATDKYIAVKDLYVDEDKVRPGDSISKAWDRGMDAIWYQIAGTAQLFDPGDGSAYYVADLSAPQVNGTGDIAAIDVVQGTDGSSADPIEGASADAESGLVYIPKSYYDDEDAKIPQAQAMVRTSLDMGQTKVDVAIDNQGHQATAVARQGVQESATFDTSLKVQVATPETAGNISGDDITVEVNGNKEEAGTASGGDASYDKETGILTIGAQPASVTGVKVTIADNGSPAGTEKAYASLASEANAMGYLKDYWGHKNKFADLSADDIKQGAYDEFTAKQLYAGSDTNGLFFVSDDRPLASAAAFTKRYLYGTKANAADGKLDYEVIKGNESADPDIWKDLSKRDVVKFESGDVAQYANFALAWPGASTKGTKMDYSLKTGTKLGWHTKKDGSKADRCGVALSCAEIGSAAIGNAGVVYGATAKAALRFVYVTDDYAIVAFLSSQFTTQAGSGLYKIGLQDSEGYVKVKKETSDASVVKGNPLYDLSGAEFTVFQNESRAEACAKDPGKVEENDWGVDTLTTDADGATDVSGNLDPGTYWIAETKAPKSGYKRSTDVKKVTVEANETATVKFEDDPIYGSVDVLLKKYNEYLEDSKAAGDAVLSGARFKIELFGNVKLDTSGTALKSWTVETDAKGEADTSGIKLPLGSYKVTETEAPEGFKISANVKNFAILQNGEKAEVSEKTISFDNARGVKDKLQFGGLTVTKSDFDLSEQKGDVSRPQGDAKLEGAVFGVYNASDTTAYADWNKNGKYDDGEAYEVGDKVCEIATYWDEASGSWIAKTDDDLLSYGTYRVVEEQAPEGYTSEGRLECTVEVHEDGQTVKKSGTEGIENKVILGSLVLGKGSAEGYTADDTDGDANDEAGSDGNAATYWNYATGDSKFEGAEFTVWNRSAEAVWFDRDGDGKIDDGEMIEKGAVLGTFKTSYSKDLDAYVIDTGQRLPYGSYEVSETKAPEGYKSDGTVRGKDSRNADGQLTYEFQIRTDGQVEQLVEGDGVLNEVKRGDVQVTKDDLELEKSETLGGAEHKSIGDDEGAYKGGSLAGIRFAVYNRSEHGVLVGGEWFRSGERIAVPEELGGDADGYLVTHWNAEKGAYTAETVNKALSYGTYGVKEVASKTLNKKELANASYLLSDGAERTFQVREDGSVVETDESGTALTWRDQAVRNDVHLEKKTVGERDSKLLAHVPFLITNVTTGERHVAVTNEDGFLSTGASQAVAGWNDHSQSTNGNDALADRVGEDGEYLDGQSISYDDVDDEAGVWFAAGEDGSQAEVDDALGALPYGEYTIQELRCESNAGYVLWSDTFSVKRDSTASKSDYNLGTVDDKPSPELGTTAADKAQGDKAVQPGQTVEDTVLYKHFDKGADIVLTTSVHKVAYGEDGSKSDGGEVEGLTKASKLTTDAESGQFDIDIALPSDLATGDYVVFETAADADGKVIAEHADIDDEGQLFEVVDGSTTATDKADGDKVVDRSAGTATIADAVDYKNLHVGQTYTMTAVLHVKKLDSKGGWVDGGVLEDAVGNAVTGTVEFTPQTRDGQVTVEVPFDPALLGSTKVVAFETCSYEGAEVFVHADIDDEDQTVDVPKIGTTATDSSDGDHIADAGAGTVKVTDVVAYEGLVQDGTYRLSGVPHAVSRADGADTALDASAGSIEFTAAAGGAGEAELSFEVDASQLADADIVIYEQVFDADTGNRVASHEDPSDAAQTVRLVRIGTTATDKADGDQVADAGQATVTISDEVAYSGLPEMDGDWKVSGTLMDKATGEAVAGPDGEPVTAEKSFDPEAAGGTAAVTFQVDDAAALAGHDLVAYERLYTPDGDLAAAHEDIGDVAQTVRLVKIGTTATDKATGTHYGQTTGTTTVTDTVDYTGLTAGKDYQMTISLVYKDTGEAVAGSDGEAYAKSQAFTPEASDGQVAVELEVPSELVAGRTVVAFEHCSADGRDVAVHADVDDEGQSVNEPSIGTTATDSESGTHEAIADSKVTVVDEIAYENLEPGVEHSYTGTLMDKATGEAVKDASGKEVTATGTFTPKKSSGTVKAEFTFDGSKLKGVEAVAFETVARGGVQVAKHEDIGDEAQTVRLTNDSSTTGKETEAPGASGDSGDSPEQSWFDKTGDWLMSNPLLAAGLALIAAGLAAGGYRLLRRNGGDGMDAAA